MTQSTDSTGQRMIWDLPTRVFHWGLAGSFLGAYLLSEQDGARTFHVMFGYTVAGLLVFRLLWGFVGSHYARFRSLAFGPATAIGYLKDLASGRARDYAGHNPAGSWAIHALLVLAAGTAVTGWLHYNGIGGGAFEEAHEGLANAWLLMVAVHVAGVIVGSLAHRRNLVATMIRGYRPATGGDDVLAVRPARALGSALLATVIGFWTWSVTTGGGSLLAGAEGDREHAELVDNRGRGEGQEEKDDD